MDVPDAGLYGNSYRTGKSSGRHRGPLAKTISSALGSRQARGELPRRELQTKRKLSISPFVNPWCSRPPDAVRGLGPPLKTRTEELGKVHGKGLDQVLEGRLNAVRGGSRGRAAWKGMEPCPVSLGARGLARRPVTETLCRGA